MNRYYFQTNTMQMALNLRIACSVGCSIVCYTFQRWIDRDNCIHMYIIGINLRLMKRLFAHMKVIVCIHMYICMYALVCMYTWMYTWIYLNVLCMYTCITNYATICKWQPAFSSSISMGATSRYCFFRSKFSWSGSLLVSVGLKGLNNLSEQVLQ